MYVTNPEQWQHAIRGVTSTANSRSVNRSRCTLLHCTPSYSTRKEAHVSLVGGVDPVGSRGANQNPVSLQEGGGGLGGSGGSRGDGGKHGGG